VSEQNQQVPAGQTSRRQKLGKWAVGVIGTVILAAIVAFSSGLGTKAAEEVGTSEGSPISASVEEESIECFTGTYLPEDTAKQVLSQAVPAEWKPIEEAPGAAPADRDSVQVAIQGESERKVTLTGIDFHVERSQRPDGAVFYRQCGGPTVGRALEVDLDATPPRITASSSEVDGMLESEVNGHSLSKPIRFPWTVSVTDPLLLEIIATTEHCYCTWTAEISWVSGSKRGIIPVDNGGDGFTVVDGSGLDSYSGAFGRWDQSNS
jgi:hypothetical protein